MNIINLKDEIETVATCPRCGYELFYVIVSIPDGDEDLEVKGIACGNREINCQFRQNFNENP